MKTTEEWYRELYETRPDVYTWDELSDELKDISRETTKAIRDEMRQEIDDNVAKVVGTDRYYTSDVHGAICSTGKCHATKQA